MAFIKACMGQAIEGFVAAYKGFAHSNRQQLLAMLFAGRMLPPALDFVVNHANAGRRVDVLVLALCDRVPRGTLMKWLRKGRVRLNRHRCGPAARVAVGDVLQLPSAVADFGAVQPADGPTPQRPPRRPRRLPGLQVAFEDAHLLIVDKPASLACHAGTGQGDDSLVARIVQHLGAENALVGHRPGLAQRLDRGVSGLVPVGKHTAALRELARQGTAHTMEKTYVALVWGRMAADEGVIDLPLVVGNEPMGNRPRTVAAATGKPAVTLYRVLHRYRDSTLLALRLRTGLTHQIRAHLLALGYPLWGDPRYGQALRNMYLHQTLGLQRPFLHGAHLQLAHPVSGQRLAWQAPVPDDLQRAVDACRPRAARDPLADAFA